MLLQRIITALVLAPLAVLAVIWLPTGIMAILAGLVFLIGFDEWTVLSGFQGRTGRLVAAALAGATLIALYLGFGVALAPWLPIIGSAWWLLALWWLRHISYAAAPTRENGFIKLGAGVLTVIPAWASLVWLHQHERYGLWLLIALLIVWGADTGAYFAGTRFGRRKLAPSISPGKTWAGVYGAIVLSVLVAWVAGWLMDVDGARLAGLLLLTVIAVAASIVGDLTESLMKRHAMVKDSGKLFPGHGGLFDRLDSVCAMVPVFALGIWVLGL